MSCKLLVPLLILSPSPFLLSSAPPSPECLDRSKWCDCDCSACRLPLSVFGKSDVSRGIEGREKAERKRERGKSSFEQQGMAVLQRTKSNVRSQPPVLCLPLSICSQSSLLSFSHTVFFNNLFLSECPIFNLLSTVSYFESTLLILFYLSTGPSPPYPVYPNL